MSTYEYLDPAAGQFWRLPFTATVGGTPVDVTSVDARVNGGPWQPMTATAGDASVFLAGPDYPDYPAGQLPAGALVLALGRNVVDVRFGDAPEVDIETAGIVIVQ